MKVTVRQVLEAVKQSGYPKYQGEYVVYDKNGPDKKVVGACPIGQAALNLRVHPMFLDGALCRVRSSWHSNLADEIANRGDKTDESVESIGASLLETLPLCILEQKIPVYHYSFGGYNFRSK